MNTNRNKSKKSYKLRDLVLKECFGYFMDPIGGHESCCSCLNLKECYIRWKETGEPSRPNRKKINPLKYESRCKDCEGI